MKGVRGARLIHAPSDQQLGRHPALEYRRHFSPVAISAIAQMMVIDTHASLRAVFV
jgi:hypothetical protein